MIINSVFAVLDFYMKTLYITLVFFFTICLFGQNQTKSIGFVENKGQIIDQKGKERKIKTLDFY